MSFFAGSLRFRGFPVPLPREQIERLIPPALYLPEDAPDSFLFVFGDQRNVRPIISPIGVDYHEATFAISNLRFRAAPERDPVVYWPKLYLDRTLPILIGWPYGYPKELTDWHQGDGELVITNRATRSPLVQVEYQDVGAGAPEGAYPVLGEYGFRQMPVVSFHEGRELVTDFRYDAGEITGCRVRARFMCPDLALLPELCDVEPIAPNVIGGFGGTQRYQFGLPKSHVIVPSPNPMPPRRPRKVAILGGGVGAISAAFALTSQPDWQQRYQITVYQMGWRLGGKGASGRNADHGQRVQEHGLHLWAGFYDKAFRNFQDCYQALHDADLLDGVFPSWDKALEPVDAIVMEEHFDGKWFNVVSSWPFNNETPGDGKPLGVDDYLHMLLRWLEHRFEHPHAHFSGEVISVLQAMDAGTSALEKWLRTTGHLREATVPWVSGLTDEPPRLDRPQLRGAHTLFARARALEAGAMKREMLGWIDELLTLVQDELAREISAFHDDNTLVYTWHMSLDLGIAVVRGALAEDVLQQGWGVLDVYDLREFLAKYGATRKALDFSVVRGGYDYVFGYQNGQIDRPALAAGVAIHGGIQVFLNYKTAILWRMMAGMGDTMFTPYYKLLKHRGVKFEFFHRIEEIVPEADDNLIARIELQQQAWVRPGIAGYEPFVRVKGLDCWPDRPQYEQLVQGAELRDERINLESFWSPWNVRDSGGRYHHGRSVTLLRGRDFDHVIVGMSVGSLKHVAPELSRHGPWRDMVENVGTVQTMAMQLWTRPGAEALGWQQGERAPVAASYAQSMNTYANMSHLLRVEDWPERGPGSIAYFCGVISDANPIPPPSMHDFPAEQLARVRSEGPPWLDKHMGHLWPHCMSGNRFDRSLLWSASANAEARMDDQFFRVNVDPSERYVLSLPNTSQYRLPAGDSGFANLFLAGDWVRTPINAGCVEAAVMGGLDAAAALSERVAGETPFESTSSGGTA